MDRQMDRQWTDMKVMVNDKIVSIEVTYQLG